MTTKFFTAQERQYSDHPKFAGVKIAVFITGRDTDTVSVSQLAIDPGVSIPIHTHVPQVDSIYIVAGEGEGFVNGEWQNISPGDYLFVPAAIEHSIRNTGSEPLILFIHHSPPLL